MVSTADAPLEQAPKAFDGVCVNVAIDVDLGGVMDAPVLIATRLQRLVRPQFVGVDGGAWQHVSLNHRHECAGFHVVSDEGTNLSAALHHSKDRRFVLIVSRAAS